MELYRLGLVVEDGPVVQRPQPIFVYHAYQTEPGGQAAGRHPGSLPGAQEVIPPSLPLLEHVLGVGQHPPDPDTP